MLVPTAPRLGSLLSLGIALLGLGGCAHAPMFAGADQRDCVERALESSASADDARAARETLERACALRDEGACGVLGVLLEHGRGGRANLPRAAWAYDRACTLGDARGCAHTSRLLLRSEDPALRRDAARALERHCARGEALACTALLDAHAAGDASPREAGRTMGLLWRACDRGDATACLSIGDRLRAQPGQEAVAQEHWMRACALGSQIACRRHTEWEPAAPSLARLDGVPAQTLRADADSGD